MSPMRVVTYAILIAAALFFLLPVYVMIITSLKPMEEIRTGAMLALPQNPSFEAWSIAWSQACSGVRCEGVAPGFWNSVQITIPSVIVSVLAGALTGYTMSFWKFRGSNLVFAILIFGAFVPYQILLYPLVRVYASLGIFGTVGGLVIVHSIFGLPLTTLMFRNFFVSIPTELFKAARVDGAGFLRIFWQIVLPMSAPIIVVTVIWQATGIWNDFLMGLVFGGREAKPMTALLNNIILSEFGERRYNVEMAATFLTALVPLAIYLLSGRWFVRGITAGSVKG
ncbi:sugar ABC transporter permease [Actibacterium mucosum KCTC 23349]|uniref:Sugar ABC transporter permease n=1 Tax=Actibacterium mucosum KCTC 23349 TaxID=1454373 RepID=A0A037ZEA3_9RHOB|nr:sugar ABC transporter permease [Actibacterium mucosum KCTC 23349]